MSLKDNFYQAIRELLDHSGLVGDDLTEKSKKSSELDAYLETPAPKESFTEAAPPAPAFRVPEPEPDFAVPPDLSAKTSNAQSTLDATANEYVPPSKQQSEYTPPTQDAAESLAYSVSASEMTVISRNTLVLGDIRSFAGISIEGSVKGQVDVVKDAYISGKVLGSLKCNNAAMRGSSLQGDTLAKGNVQLDNNSMLLGNLNAQYANVDGKVKGNLDVSGKVEVDSNAVILGDVRTSTLSVVDGANIKGFVNTTFLTEDVERVFPGNIAIADEEEFPK